MSQSFAIFYSLIKHFSERGIQLTLDNILSLPL